MIDKIQLQQMSSVDITQVDCSTLVDIANILSLIHIFLPKIPVVRELFAICLSERTIWRAENIISKEGHKSSLPIQEAWLRILAGAVAARGGT